ncbi:MAG: sigma-70 family RNA polymerase sigma factor [Pseudomonadota bacterium]
MTSAFLLPETDDFEDHAEFAGRDTQLTTPSDPRPALKVSEGQFDAFARRAAAHRPALVRRLARIGAQPELAKDLAQEAIAVGLARLRSGVLRDRHKIENFLYRTAYFLWIGERRRRSRTLPLCDVIGALHDADSDPYQESESTATGLRDMLQSLLDQLPSHRDRELLRRYFFADQEKATICACLSLTNRHFDRVLSRAKTRLRNLAFSPDNINKVMHYADLLALDLAETPETNTPANQM